MTSPAACTVQLVKQQSRSECNIGRSFGCNDTTTMWINHGCRGWFAFGGTSLQCGVAGHEGGFHYCSPAKALRDLASGAGMPALTRILGGTEKPSDYVANAPADCTGYGRGDWRQLLWRLCDVSSRSTCLVFSIGVGNDWSFETLALQHGCEVHSFDPTIALREVHEQKAADIARTYPRLHFHFLGLGASTQYNGSYSRKGKHGAPGLSEVQQLDELVRRFAAGRTVDVLKIDCEGCEYPTFDYLVEKQPAQLCGVQQLLMEVHASASMGLTAPAQLRRLLRHAWVDHDFRVFSSVIAEGLTEDRSVAREVNRAGLPSGLCCYNIHMRRVGRGRACAA